MRRLLLCSTFATLLAATAATAQSGLPFVSPPTQRSTPAAYAAPAPASACAPAIAQAYAAQDDDALNVWASGEFLYWVTRGLRVPPLVTTSPVGTPQTSAGVLGTPGVRTLFGDRNLNNDFQPGFRVSAGANLLDGFGVEASVFYLLNQNDNPRFSSPGSPILSRPFFNAATNTQASQLVAFPGVLAGSVGVSARTEFLGADANASCCLASGCGYSLRALVGYRFLRLSDELNVREELSSTSTASPVAPGTQITVQDRFRAKNHFHGGQVGLAGRVGETFFVDFAAKFAVGCTQSDTTIYGTTRVAPPVGPATTRSGGLLTQRSNFGSFDNSKLAFVPDLSLRLGYQVTENISVTVGYTFLYWSSVYRVGDQIDTRVNGTQIPPGPLVGAARPAFPNKDTDFWAQGVTAGIEFKW